MKALATLVLALSASSLAAFADADQYGVRSGPPTGNPGVNAPAAVALIDAWNDVQIPTIGTTYAADCFGFPYTPSQTYNLDRIEFYAGDRPGTVTVAILADDGSGFPTGPVLGTVTYQETSPRRWQGASPVPSVELTAGTLYYVRYQVVPLALLSKADTGVLFTHAWSFSTCANWNGVATVFAWMARFYGDVVTPTRRGSWGTIKMLYR